MESKQEEKKLRISLINKSFSWRDLSFFALGGLATAIIYTIIYKLI